MGTTLSRQNADVEEADVTVNQPYKYPPRTGTMHNNAKPDENRTLVQFCVRMFSHNDNANI